MSFKQPHHPSSEILKKYADVLVNFALGGGKGIKKGEVVRVMSSESGKRLFTSVCNAIVMSGGHVISNYSPDDEQGDKRRAESFTRFFYEHAQPHQITFFPKKYLKGMAEQIDHSVYILADADPRALQGVDPKKIMQRGKTLKPFKDWLNRKEWAGKFTWTIAMYGTPAMAREAGLSEREYWQQIIKACFLDQKNPIAKWKQVYREIEKYRSRLNKLSPKIDKLHAVGRDMDIWYTLGEKRAWHAGSGRNIPSFEIFTSPDWRGTNGWIRVNQPLYRYGNKVTGIELWFKDGLVVKSKAKTNEKLLKEMIATPGANKIGEYSLTDKRHSRITKFMAETLFDENMGGPYGNSHIALGMSYRDTYAGDVSKLTDKEAKRLGFNDSSVHTDVVSTTNRTVTAHLKNGSKKVIYKNGMFVL
ncbi:thermophilic metalloprotease (M29) superfamily [Candidatus Kaiserbacteria bacterium RIFCSPHIGHO2_01_FULL_54_36]|uniref:Thermophilic metalloprotease (M29) superfamily n=1 Tax=Candidatus Kaiserbacteria bacterium RIFCSPHIGHO2_01_FULL_54_36 TaxID=1798482 RepID=A0A1F6CPG4_9BACT|nr:MAG: thermophilic metalloprotease (M29) superfamily [Candidatus Kaiserbacteria bacterium RIFCSPHIGHO2_01_FULL_54_36]OGG76010.1 MAG: thermophilic metalloprotease (M29) superfamily [Candidatus Kaiserbacteria bacterium RIFCSPLOWO2_01_FULL_54_22]